MKLVLRTLVIALLASMSLSYGLAGQSSVTKVTDLNLGWGQQSEVQSIFTYQDKGLVLFKSITGDGTEGLISTLEPNSLGLTSLTTLGETSRFGLGMPNYFNFGETALLNRLSNNLTNSVFFLSNGELTALNQTFSAIRAAAKIDNLVYFVSENRSRLPLELWATDGTEAGTYLISNLPGNFYIRSSVDDHVSISAGDKGLLISLTKSNDQTFYYFDSQEESFTSIGYNSEPIKLGGEHYDYPKETVTYIDGTFLFWGKECLDSYYCPAKLYALQENTFEPQVINLGVGEYSNGENYNYNRLDFAILDNEVFILATRLQNLVSNDLYRINLSTNNSELIYSESLWSATNFACNLQNQFINNNTLYYLSRRSTDSVGIFSFSVEMATPKLHFNIYAREKLSYGKVLANSKSIYAFSSHELFPREAKLTRYSKANHTTTDVKAASYASANQQAVVPEGIFMHETWGIGALVFLDEESSVLDTIPDLTGANVNYSITTKAYPLEEESHCILSETLEGSFVFNTVDQSLESISEVPLVKYFDKYHPTYFSANRTDASNNMYLLRDVQFERLQVDYRDTNQDSYSIQPNRYGKNGKLLLSFRPNANSPFVPLLGEVNDLTIRLKEFLLNADETIHHASNNQFICSSMQVPDEGECINIYDFDGTPLMDFILTDQKDIIEITDTGVYVDSLQEEGANQYYFLAVYHK